MKKETLYVAFSTQKGGVGKTTFTVLVASYLYYLKEAIKTADEYLASAGSDYDVVFFDLPGTVNSEGVINSLSGVDYIFTPIAADRVVLESSLSFAVAIHKLLVKNEACRLKGLHLFWNMVDGREKTDLYTLYEQTIGELDAQRKTVFRSTLFPADKRLVKGSNMEELITEIAYLIKL